MLTKVKLFILASVLALLSLPVSASDDPFQRDGRLMWKAIQDKDIGRVKLLLRSHYIDPNGYTNNRGQRARFINAAVTYSTPEILELILKAGATETTTMHGCPDEMPLPLFSALVDMSSKQSVSPKLDLLVKYKIGNLNQNVPNSLVKDCARENRSAIHYAIKEQYKGSKYIGINMLDNLLSNGASINGTDYSGWTLAHKVSLGTTNHNSKIVTTGMQYAIDKGLNIHLQSTTNDKLRAIDMTHLLRVPNGAQCQLGRQPDQKSLEKLFIDNGSPKARTDLKTCKNCVACVYKGKYFP